MSNKFVLILTVLGALGGIIVAAPSWESLLTPNAVGGFLLAIASTVGAAYGVKVVK